MEKARSINVEEMWSLMNKEDKNWGIEGYNAPRKYHNIPKLVVTKLKDKDGNPIKFKRLNYLDDIVKWSNSFFSKERAEKVKEYYDSHNRSLEEYQPKVKESKTKESCQLYKHNRLCFTDELIKNEKKKSDVYESKKDAIEELRKEIEEKNKEREANNPVKQMIDHYKNGSLPLVTNKGGAIESLLFLIANTLAKSYHSITVKKRRKAQTKFMRKVTKNIKGKNLQNFFSPL